jgi:hypothetical protein
MWARDAVGQWHQQFSDPDDLLVGELPLIGNRLIELAQRRSDSVEALLAGEETLFLIPVPSREVRQVIEAARTREMASPIHERERANAVPSLVQALWEEIAAVGRALAIRPTRLEAGAGAGPEAEAESSWERGFDPELYAVVYERLLRHRRTARLDVTSALPVQASVYDALDVASELVPTSHDVERIMAEVGVLPEAEVERDVAGWFRL